MKLLATMKKDTMILSRDRAGLGLMFGMPILLVIIVTAMQNNTFQLLNKNKITLLLCNRDTGSSGLQLIRAIEGIGMFNISIAAKSGGEAELRGLMHSKDAMLGLVIPADFTVQIKANAGNTAGKALKTFGIQGDSVAETKTGKDSLHLFYAPVLQESFRMSIIGALNSALQMVQSREILRTLYSYVNGQPLQAAMENDMLSRRIAISDEPISTGSGSLVPNATQHNVPAWTIFAMFFVVISLGGSVVKEKLNGSFIRLKTLPTSYYLSLLSKQVTYLFVTVLQAAVIFAIGLFVFPLIGLPILRLPSDASGLVLVTLICGYCAVSYAICVGVFASTQEQANSFGAVSIVILAAIGGLMVPVFAMPDSFRTIMKISPLYWCLEAYYGLFLEGGKLKDVLNNIIPLLGVTACLQLITIARLKQMRII